MTKFTSTFVHVLEHIYKFEIEAETKEEAFEKPDEHSFDYLSQDEPIDEQGINVERIQFDEDDELLPEE